MDFLNRQESRYIESSYAPKAIKVFRNGDSSLQGDIVLKQSTTFEQLKTEALQRLGLKNKGTFRLFTSEGLELYEDYIPLIKDKEHLYVSLGEDFDQNTTLTDYKEIKVLGRGGFGKVVLVEHQVTGEHFAVKYVNAKKYGLASLIDMVFSEAELLKNLKHKNIVEIINFFKLKDLRVIFVMEYLEGGELGDYLRAKGKLTEEEALGIFTQLVDAVHFCHMNKIIHRDLKPENILFESKDSNVIKVVDFGIAGLYSGYKFDVTDAGSLRYMSPELLTGENKAANPAIDIWSMGCILYALLHGRPPFTGAHGKEIMEAIVKCDYKFDPEVRSKLSPACIDIIQRMLNRDYQTRVSTLDLISHPWLNGQKTMNGDDHVTEEAKEIVVEEPKPKKKLATILGTVLAKNKEAGIKNSQDRKLSSSFHAKEKSGVGEMKTLRVPGQNTLNRAITRESKGSGADKIQAKKEMKSSLVKKTIARSFGDTDNSLGPHKSSPEKL